MIRAIVTRTPLVDLHSHILPGVDDGARDDSDALEMLRIAVEDGIETIVATPHSEFVTPKDITTAVDRLNRLAAGDGIDIQIMAGCEVFIAPDLVEQVRQGRLVTLNGTAYVLLELSLVADWPMYLQTTIYELQVAGLMPIIAHAERYPPVQQNLDILQDLITAGVVIQINSSSLLGRTGDRSQTTAEALVRRRMAHIIASDAHSPGRRAPRVRAALERASDLAGPQYAAGMQERAVQILHGEPVKLPDPIASPEPQSLASRFRKLLSRD